MTSALHHEKERLRMPADELDGFARAARLRRKLEEAQRARDAQTRRRPRLALIKGGDDAD